MGFRPEEKGIKTYHSSHPALLCRWDSDLKKKGLRRFFTLFSFSTWMGFRPEEKGIKTSRISNLSMDLRWDSDLKKKGLRLDTPGYPREPRADGIPT